ncbi:oxidoreductase [Nocardia sp. SYP-A9097]|uniref:ferredoxin reductase n=1 Tax=Nocardia sp. SYP-A9097 TaxID=2663237 RepID=UPI00129AEAA0|nr:ferredoxin reductase [Nocardia sp. SYP-A9097]MRH92074.1 oxidoreductase [Nocardia sp. SYP-A9097]
MRWQPAELTAARSETPSARTLTLRVPGWPGHLPGQHVDVRLTAPDGYHAERSYSLAAPADGDHIELTIQRVPDGEVSGYLVDYFPVGARIEIRGPVGGWFVWHPETGGAAVLIAGGSGIVPLAAILRARRKAPSANPFRLIYALRDPEDLYYRNELLPPDHELSAVGGAPTASAIERLAPAAEIPLSREPVASAEFVMPGDDVEVFLAFSRSAPPAARPPGRLTAEEIAKHSLTPAPDVTCYVCGPTPFVEFAASALVSAGHDPALIRTERFGPTGK